MKEQTIKLLLENGFVMSTQKSVVLERVAEHTEDYTYRGSKRTREIYSADFVTKIHADGTVSGFSPSNYKADRRFDKINPEDL